jgi:hypothetical protein
VPNNPYDRMGIGPRAVLGDAMIQAQPSSQPMQRPARPMRMPMRRPNVDIVRTTVDFRPTPMRKR